MDQTYEQYRQLDVDLKRIIREMEELRHQLQLMERKIDDISSRMTTQDLNRHVGGSR